MSKHTPGPWTVEAPTEDSLTIVQAGKPTYEWDFIAHCPLPDEENPLPSTKQVKANARLIAAAPDLLAALKALRDAVKASKTMEGREHVGLGIQVNAAISKAEGTQ